MADEQPVTQQAIATTSALQLPYTTAELNPVQIGWIGFANQRLALTPVLQNGELAIQALVQKALKTTDLPTIQSLMKEAKAQSMKDLDARRKFTALFEEKVAKPLMEFEKRNEALIGQVAAHELSVRSAAAAAATKAQAKETEKAQLKAHITSEYFRCAALYRQQLDAIVTTAYTTSLETGILIRMEVVGQRIAAEPMPDMTQRPLVNLTVEEANEIFYSVPPYDRNAIVTAAMQEMANKWQNFQYDLANATSAIAAANIELQEKAVETQQAVIMETGVNNLQAAAVTATIPIGPTVKKNMEVLVLNTREWLISVLSHYMKNINEVSQYVRVKTADKLSVGQMASALGQYATKTGITYEGLELVEALK